MKRTEFIRLSASMAAFFALPSVQKTEQAQLIERLTETKGTGSAANLTAAPIQTVRIAIIGMGNRGSSLIDMFEYMVREKMAHIAVLCDIDAAKTERGKAQVKAIQSDEVDLVSSGEDGWKDVIRRDDIDLVVICTPWELHAEMALAAMENGKHVAVEVPAAYTLDDCWRIIETAERTRRHHIMLENCCYNDEELWLLNMAQAGVFGDLTHAECAYIHDLRQLMIDETYYADQWRLKHHIDRDGNLYTTHGLGPVSMYFDIGRGDYYRHLVSMSSKEAALSAATRGKTGLPQQFKCGDMNTTLLKTFEGRSVMLQFDTHTGRPYSRINTLCGTKAVHQGYPSKLYIDHGPTWDWHRWTDETTYSHYRAAHQHPFWKAMQAEALAKSAGHGGMDFIMMWRLIDCLNKGKALDLNVYDGILWSAITPLTEASVAMDSAPTPIPDFTSGTWDSGNQKPWMAD